MQPRTDPLIGELVVIDSNDQPGKHLLSRQAAPVKEGLQRSADHPPTDDVNPNDTVTETTQTRRELPRGQHVPVFDLHLSAFPQVGHCRGCLVCPAHGTHLAARSLVAAWQATRPACRLACGPHLSWCHLDHALLTYHLLRYLTGDHTTWADIHTTAALRIPTAIPTSPGKWHAQQSP